MIITQLHVFTKTRELGNPAAVIQEFNGNFSYMSELAKKLNLPVIAFILNDEKTSASTKLRFFAPATLIFNSQKWLICWARRADSNVLAIV